LRHNIGFKRRKFKEFRGFLEKSVFNSSFSDYEITEKSFIVNMTFNFNQNFIMNTQKSKKRGSLPNQKDARAVKRKKYIMDILKLIRF